MQREVTRVEALSWVVALSASTAALSLALLLFVADREERATTYAVGGLVLAVWAALRLTDRHR